MLCVRIHQNHEVVGETSIFQVSVEPAPGGLLSPLQHLVDLIQVQVTEYGGKHSTLGKTLRTSCLDHQFQQMHDLRVIDSPRDFLEQDVMPDIVEKGTQVEIK